MHRFCRPIFEEEYRMTHLRFLRSVVLVILGFAFGGFFVTISQHFIASAQRDNAARPTPTRICSA